MHLTLSQACSRVGIGTQTARQWRWRAAKGLELHDAGRSFAAIIRNYGRVLRVAEEDLDRWSKERLGGMTGRRPGPSPLGEQSLRRGPDGHSPTEERQAPGEPGGGQERRAGGGDAPSLPSANLELAAKCAGERSAGSGLARSDPLDQNFKGQLELFPVASLEVACATVPGRGEHLE